MPKRPSPLCCSRVTPNPSIPDVRTRRTDDFVLVDIEAFKFDDPYHRRERGEIGAPQYFAHLRTVLKLRTQV